MALPGGGLIRFARGRGGAVPAAELLSTLPTPVLVIDPEGCVRDANIAAEAMLNVSRAGLLGRPVADAIGHPLTSMPIDQPFAAYDLNAVLPGGREARLDVMATPLPERPGWRSLTLHARAPQHLTGRSEEREGGRRSAVAAAAMLAHEIKNPLSGIRGAAQLVAAGLDEDGRALTDLIRDEVDRVAALIDRMEGFTDTRPLALGPQNIHSVLGHVLDVARQGFARGHALRELYDPSLPEVMGHRDALVQIFINLVKNAAEAIERAGSATGTVTITTAYRHGVAMGSPNRPGQRRMLPIEVCVIDDGPGAPSGIAGHMFEPFVSSKRSGGGLGLALVEKLVGDLGGSIEYARQGRPERTVFRVLLPRA